MNNTDDHIHQLATFVSRLLYLVVAFILLGISLLLVGYGLWEVWTAVHMATSEVMDKLLDAIGVIVVSLALFDITKYLIVEEVTIKQTLSRTIQETEHMLTKFLSIIAVAISMEALVFIFRTGKADVTQLLFPIILLFAGMCTVLTLGLYTRITRSTRCKQKLTDENQIQ
jgi:hypothetical protein